MNRKGELKERLGLAMWAKFGHGPQDSEIRSWENSIPTVVSALLEVGLEHVEVLLELRHPLTQARMDMVLVGSRPGEPNVMSVVVVENKQWSEARVVPESRLVELPRYLHFGQQTHPSDQVWNYCLALGNYLPVAAAADLRGLVNLHEATSGDVESLLFLADELDPEVTKNVRIFTADSRDQLLGHLSGVLSSDNAALHADHLLGSPRRPTPKLLASVTECVRDRSVFPLLEPQQRAVEKVRQLVRTSSTDNRKHLVIVKGGPGTGKSVVALELLGQLSRDGKIISHAVGGKYLAHALRDNLAGTRTRAAQSFTYFSDYAHSEPNSLDVLIADEAHRIRKTGSVQYRSSTTAQVEDLINAARVPVFLLDDHQVTRADSIGSVALIEEAAARLDVGVHTITLDHQFRCGGSAEYTRWIDRLFGIDKGGPLPWRPLDDYELYVAPTPEAMEAHLSALRREGPEDEPKVVARIAAGFCWPWSRKYEAPKVLPREVVIGDWARPWNAADPAGRRTAPDYVPATSMWTTHPNAFEQVGCVYTAQGFEYEHAGVIIGPDLTWSPDGTWHTDRTRNEDPAVKRARLADLFIRTVYRVLATRGTCSTVLYATDPATTKMLLALGVPPLPERPTQL
ncbi:DUF2075 domain-containing protein [Actinokineospora sp. PR83]|uniref:DUF2075 domain-containing protein n=1 Tax=Actinokineospora sp. PR83 TaxID=2884908 RepID=UPI001F23DE2E|nr:DUF2075 domain-containing protein [Actinokineospora sp. PR83]MCG8916066.1 DUF2075 domain-containing protein [Actinokineospora sp. PR83]